MVRKVWDNLSFVQVRNQDYANLRECHIDDWWCGSIFETLCRTTTSNGAHTSGRYTFASFLGFATNDSPTITSTSFTSFISPTSFTSPSITSQSAIVIPSWSSVTTAQECTAESKNYSTLQTKAATATTIGLGVGLPLGGALIVFLVFFFWRERRRKHSKPSKASRDQNLERPDDRMSRQELPDSQVPWELDHRMVKVEAPAASSIVFYDAHEQIERTNNSRNTSTSAVHIPWFSYTMFPLHGFLMIAPEITMAESEQLWMYSSKNIMHNDSSRAIVPSRVIIFM